jgi:choline dehydrogenase-like flavoprotein
MLQSTGIVATYGVLYFFLSRWFDVGLRRKLQLVRHMLRIPVKAAELLFGPAAIFAMIIEDFPYPENRIAIDPQNPKRIKVVYTISTELRERAKWARSLLRRSLGHFAVALQGDVQLNLGHACGTCRFGNDPKTSVLDADCKAHELENLYVVDASFMPRSGGANPGLTIIANALRVGDKLNAKIKSIKGSVMSSNQI